MLVNDQSPLVHILDLPTWLTKRQERALQTAINLNKYALTFFYISEEGNQVKLNFIVQKKERCQVARVKIENLIAVDSSERQLKTRVRLKN